MTDITRLAKGEPCQIRVPGYCCFDPEQTVPCHLRMMNLSGAGMKAADLLVAWGCTPCHDVVDGRTRTRFTYDQRRLMILEGIARTLVLLVAREVVTW